MHRLHCIFQFSMFVYLLTCCLTASAGDFACSFEGSVGHTAGGQRVFVTGTSTLYSPDSPGDVQLLFDGIAAAHKGFGVSPHGPCPFTVGFDAPPHPAGVVDVLLVTPFGEHLFEDAFTYLAAPEILSLNQSVAGVRGNNYIEITADAMVYSPLPEVYFNDQPATLVSLLNARTLTCWTPAHVAGPAVLRLVNNDGSEDSIPFEFRPFKLTEVMPSFGWIGRRNRIEIYGEGFSGRGMQVRFGDIQAEVGEYLPLDGATRIGFVDVVSDMEGTVDVTVIDPSGATQTLDDAFTFLSPTTISSIYPVGGHVTGGLTATIRLSSWPSGSATSVYFGDELAEVLGPSSHSPGTAPYLLVAVPPHPAGTVEVRVEESGAGATAGLPFTYYGNPVITEIIPSTGSTAGSNFVSIIGSAFTVNDFENLQVLMDGVAVPYLDVLWDEGPSLRILTPPHPAGDVTLTVVNGDGSQSDVTFRYESLNITGVNPATGLTLGMEPVQILGSGFSTVDVEVYFDERLAEFNSHESSSEVIVAKAPSGVVGPADVTVRNPDGTAFTLPNAYTYLPSTPEFLGVTPKDGLAEGGNTVRLFGRRIGDPRQVQVLFDGIAATEIEVVPCGHDQCPDYTIITCRVPAHVVGPVDVTLVNQDGASATLANEYTFVDSRPANDTFTSAIELAPNETITGSNATAENGGGSNCRTSRDVFYRFSSLESGTMSMTLCADSMYGWLGVRNYQTGTNECAPGTCQLGSVGTGPTITFPVEPCQQYQVSVASTDEIGGDFTLTTQFTPDNAEVRTPPENDGPADAVALISNEPVVGTLACATDTDMATCISGSGNSDVWYFIEAGAHGLVTLSYCPLAEFGSIEVMLYDEGMNQLACHELGSCGELKDTPIDAAGVYLVRVVSDFFYADEFSLRAIFPPSVATEGEGDSDGEPLGDGEGIGDGEGEEFVLPEIQVADVNANSAVDLSELLRLFQFHNAQAFHCAEGTEDGYAPGIGTTLGCGRHTTDYGPTDWSLSLSEIMRAIQFHNAGGYQRCEGSEDGYCLR